jgi:hypothetical protein
VPPAQKINQKLKRKKAGDGKNYKEDKPMRGRKEKEGVRGIHEKYPLTGSW